jgi:hypothetical protein
LRASIVKGRPAVFVLMEYICPGFQHQIANHRVMASIRRFEERCLSHPHNSNEYTFHLYLTLYLAFSIHSIHRHLALVNEESYTREVALGSRVMKERQFTRSKRCIHIYTLLPTLLESR